MGQKSVIPYLFAAIPFVTLILAIPYVNRVEPMIWGMPFLLGWIVINVLLTPIWLGCAYWFEKRARVSCQSAKTSKGCDCE